MKNIYALTDYHDNFGSKWKSSPYRSGYNKNLLFKYFNSYGWTVTFMKFKDVSFDSDFWQGKIVIYTSSEEVGLKYKSFIEDVILGLTIIGAKVIPGFMFLRANNNKVFMEILQKVVINKPLQSRVFGTFEEFFENVNNIETPCVIKSAESRMSRGVLLAKNRKQLINYTKKVSRTINVFPEIKEIIRKIVHQGYCKESKNQDKFIIQPFIKGLEHDYKMLIYWDKIYILKRGIKKGDFRASGSGVGYMAGSKSEFPLHMFSFVYDYFLQLDVPNISIDFGYDIEKDKGYIFEIQALYYGTSTQDKSVDYYKKEGNKFVLKNKTFDQERDYAYSIAEYLDNKRKI